MQVNAKLSDYGIACYATESGLTQPMGTAGCKAPELLAANISYMPYNEKVGTCVQVIHHKTGPYTLNIVIQSHVAMFHALEL